MYEQGHEYTQNIHVHCYVCVCASMMLLRTRMDPYTLYIGTNVHISNAINVRVSGCICRHKVRISISLNSHT